MTMHAELGINRTGISTSPALTQDMLAGREEFPPDVAGDERNIALFRAESVQQWNEPLGSVPPPTTVKGMVKSGVTALKGESPVLLIDKLGARLAFERTGVRLYEALLSKFDATGGFDAGPTRVELEGILEDEFNHFSLLKEALTQLGADPTVMTPSADLQATIGAGAMHVIVEPRTNFAQCLEAAVTIELVDNESWDALTALADQSGQRELATRFKAALVQETMHLLHVRRWLANSQGITRSDATT